MDSRRGILQPRLRLIGLNPIRQGILLYTHRTKLLSAMSHLAHPCASIAKAFRKTLQRLTLGSP